MKRYRVSTDSEQIPIPYDILGPKAEIVLWLLSLPISTTWINDERTLGYRRKHSNPPYVGRLSVVTHLEVDDS